MNALFPGNVVLVHYYTIQHRVVTHWVTIVETGMGFPQTVATELEEHHCLKYH